MHEDTSVVSTLSNNVIKYATLLFVFLIPLFVFPAVWVSIPQGKVLVAAVLIVLGLIAWLVGSISRRRIVFSRDSIIVAAVLLPLAYAISALATSAPLSSYISSEALQGTVASMLILLGAALLGSFASENKRTSITVVLTLFASGALVLTLQIVRLLWPGVIDFSGALAGNTSSVLGSWHDLGIFAGFILLLAYGFLETSVASNRIFAICLHVLAFLSAVVVLAVNFSDIWYALAGGAVLFALSCVLRAYRRHGNIMLSVRAAFFWILLALLCSGFGFYNAFVFERLPAILQVSQTEVRPSLEGTFAAGQNLYQGGKALVFGSGPNTFDRQWALFKPTEVNATNFWNTDFQFGYGVLPTAVVTVGVVGVLMWLLLALALLWTGFKSFTDENEGRLRAILFISCIFLLFYHIIYVPSIALSLLMFLLFGVLAGLNGSSWYREQLALAPQKITIFIGLLVLSCTIIGAALMESRTIVSSLYTARASTLYQSTGNLQLAADLVQKSVQIDPRNDIAQRAAVQVGLLQFAELVKTGSNEVAAREKLKQTLSDTIAHGLAAVSIDDSSYQNWLALAGLYQSLAGVGIQGAYDQAQSAWMKAASTTPSNPYPFVQLGQIAMAQGRNAEAVQHFTRAIELKPNLALPYYLRAQIEAGEQKYEQAVNDAAAAAQLASQDPLSWYTLGVILYAAKDNTNAIASLEKAISLQNNYSDALFALAILYDAVGERERAILAAQKVVELNPANEIAARVLSNLQQNKTALDGLQGQASTPQSPAETETP